MGKANEKLEGTVTDFVDNAKGELEALCDELNDWASNLESANMEHLPKYDEVTCARDQLQAAVDALEGIDMGTDFDVHLVDEDHDEGMITPGDMSATAYQDGRKSASSRPARRDNAIALLIGAHEALEELRDSIIDGTKTKTDLTAEQKEARVATSDMLDALCSELDGARDEAEAADFPRAFG